MTDRCRFCGKTLRQHRDVPALFTPRVPCLGLKEHFLSRGHSMVLDSDLWHMRLRSRIGDWLIDLLQKVAP